MIKLATHHETFELAQSFNISRGAKTQALIVRVVVSDGEYQGQGECVPYARYNETIESVISQIKSLPPITSREQLQEVMPAGAARNAVDCALWDLEAKQSGTPVWQLAGLDAPQPVTTAYTLSLDTPQKMLAQAIENNARPLLKIKLGTVEDIPRLEAVREGAPHSKIIVDANEGWSIATFEDIQTDLKRLKISMVEQPLHEQDDEALRDKNFSIPLCADESAHTSEGLESFVGKYDMVNIKLDKTGGLTQAIQMKQKAQELGLGVFIGCMVASSLAMAPALLLAPDADFIDLDGPLLLKHDRANNLHYDGSIVHPANSHLWG